jgi:hypothetical protein
LGSCHQLFLLRQVFCWPRLPADSSQVSTLAQAASSSLSDRHFVGQGFQLILLRYLPGPRPPALPSQTDILLAKASSRFFSGIYLGPGRQLFPLRQVFCWPRLPADSTQVSTWAQAASSSLSDRCFVGQGFQQILLRYLPGPRPPALPSQTGILLAKTSS